MRHWVEQNITMHEDWDFLKCMRAFLGHDADDVDDVVDEASEVAEVGEVGEISDWHLHEDSDEPNDDNPSPPPQPPPPLPVAQPVERTESATQTPPRAPANRRDAEFNRLIQQLLEHRVQYAADWFQDRVNR